ncbi:hypothetical protein [Bradyrhizobium sp. RDM4]|uniref:hypothetical protein n=1 Tax=Bradyrhizobium sp. RDM4 TaxID=3378765 RepID=UPI0038FCEAEB
MTIHPHVTSEQEATVKQLLRRASKRMRASQVFSIVPHAREMDANREFASDRGADNVVWFFGALTVFMVVYVICLKIGAI